MIQPIECIELCLLYIHSIKHHKNEYTVSKYVVNILFSNVNLVLSFLKYNE